VNNLQEAIKIANRSSIRKHRTGAIIVSNEVVVSNGWSHIPATKVLTSCRSLHAELHALARARYRYNLNGAACYVATLSAADNVVNAKPCLQCAIALRAAGVEIVYFTTSDGSGWSHLLLTSDAVFQGLKVYEPNGH
jgi:tRNA(Arg) A34 adenosine deaminase TadA